MNIYNELVKVSQNFEVKYEFANEPNFSLKMTSHENPWSLKLSEFLFLKNFIIKNDITKVYEVATAFGISTLALGLGLKETNGKLVTMDAYIEETVNSAGGYIGTKQTFSDSDGFKSVINLINHFDLKNTVFPFVGWSPDDTSHTINNIFNEDLEMFFIDAGHWDDALIQDINSIIPHLNKEKIIVFIHDTHCFTNQCIITIEQLLNSKLVYVEECRYPNGFNLSYIQNGFNLS